MKTLKEFYDTVTSNKDIMAEFVKASSTDSLSDFAKKYDCTASDDEIKTFFMTQSSGENESQEEGMLSDDDLENVSGGSVFFVSWIMELFAKLFGCQGSDVSTPDNSAKTLQYSQNQKYQATNLPATGKMPSASNAILDNNSSNYKATWC